MAVAPEIAPAPAPAPVPAPAPAPSPPAPEIKPDAVSLFDAIKKPEVAPAPVDQAGPPKLTFKERPDWLGEKYFDPKTGEVKLEELAKAENAWRTKIAQSNKAPEKADGYKLEFGDDPDIKSAAEALGVGDDDPVWKGVREAAHEEGVSQSALSKIVNRFLKEQAALLPAPVDMKQELVKLGQHGPAIIQRNWDFGEQMLKTGTMTQEEVDAFRAMQYDALGMRVVSKILEHTGAVPEIRIAAMQQAAATPDAAALDKELAEIMARGQKGENVQAEFEANQDKRKKLFGDASQRSWPPPAA